MTPFLTLLLMLVMAGLLVAGLAVTLMAYGLLRPPRLNDGKALYWLRRLSPGDLGLEFEDADFQIRDEHTGKSLKIAGWWIPAPASPAGEAGRCVVLLHGYADAKVGAIAWAPLLHELGLHVLAIDLRAHGDSEGKQSTAGYFERHDVSQAIDQLRAERPRQTQQLALFGISLGGAVALGTAALRGSIGASGRKSYSLSPVPRGEGRDEGPDATELREAVDSQFIREGSEQVGRPGSQQVESLHHNQAGAAPHPNPLPRVLGRGNHSDVAPAPGRDIAAIVLESPFADFRVAAVERIVRLGLPGGRVAASALRLAEWISGADFHSVRPVDLIGKVPCPLLILSTQGGECPSPTELGPLQTAMQSRPAEWGPSELHHFAADPRLLGMVADPEAYRERLRGFFHAALDQPEGSACSDRRVS